MRKDIEMNEFIWIMAFLTGCIDGEIEREDKLYTIPDLIFCRQINSFKIILPQIFRANNFCNFQTKFILNGMQFLGIIGEISENILLF